MTAEEGTKAPFVIDLRDGFKTDIAQVDGEHRRLFHLVKTLDLRTVEQTLEELLEYVVTHFANEQALMERSGYPAFDHHLKLHEEFGNHVADFLGGGEAWTDDRVQALRRFLDKWLIGHIMTHDLRFGKWYAENGHRSASRVRVAPEQRGFLARLFGLR